MEFSIWLILITTSYNDNTNSRQNIKNCKKIRAPWLTIIPARVVRVPIKVYSPRTSWGRDGKVIITSISLQTQTYKIPSTIIIGFTISTTKFTLSITIMGSVHGLSLFFTSGKNDDGDTPLKARRLVKLQKYIEESS